MIRLQVRFRLQERSHLQAPLLGYALHGLFEGRISERAVPVARYLRDGQMPWYAIAAPPAGCTDNPLRWELRLFGPLAERWQPVAMALLGRPAANQDPEYLESRDWRARIDEATVDVLSIAGEPVPAALAAIQPPERFQVRRPPLCSTPNHAAWIELELLSPLTLTTASKRKHGGRNEVPALASIAASAHTRLSKLLPQWLPASAHPAVDWQAQCESATPHHPWDSIHGQHAAHHSSSDWWFPGFVGTLRWSGQFGSELLRLLELGEVVGVGQGTARGGGRYRTRAG